MEGPLVLPTAIQPPGVVRLAVVAADGRRSSTWRVWSERAGDLYISARRMGSEFKTSLHQSGTWQTGFTSKMAQREGFPLDTRHVDTWDRPEPFGPGARRAYGIVFPESELSRLPPDTGNIVVLDAPGEGQARWVHVVMVEAGNVMIVDPPSDEVARFDLGPLGQAVLVTEVADWAAPHRAEIEAKRAQSRAMSEAAGVRITETTRSCMLATQADGTRLMIDVDMSRA